MVKSDLFSSKIKIVGLSIFVVILILFLKLVLINYLMERRNGYHADLTPYYSRSIPQDLLSTLPPNPGKDGDLTIEGIDSNTNLVRDDMEILIAYLAPDSLERRLALTQYTKTSQKFLLSSNASEAIKNGEERMRAYQCVTQYYGDFEERLSVTEAFKTKMFNTKNRRDLLHKIDESRGTVFGTYFENPCDF